MRIDITTEQALLLHEFSGKFYASSCMNPLFEKIDDRLKKDKIIKHSLETEGLAIEGRVGALTVDSELMKKFIRE